MRKPRRRLRVQTTQSGIWTRARAPQHRADVRLVIVVEGDDMTIWVPAISLSAGSARVAAHDMLSEMDSSSQRCDDMRPVRITPFQAATRCSHLLRYFEYAWRHMMLNTDANTMSAAMKKETR